ncbi:hypothetical protein Dimus_034038 [Dionaea muscipula]
MAAASLSISSSTSILLRTHLITRSKMTVNPIAILSTSSPKMKSPYELKLGQNRQFHELPSGLKMEVLVQKGIKENITKVHGVIEEPASPSSPSPPPLVFIHGSYHAAWCWAEHWLPFFSQQGFDCYALSLLGQGESDSPATKVAGTLQTHASDVAHFIQKELPLPPVLLGHSFGGLIVQNFIANTRNKQALGAGRLQLELAGAVLVCSVPPTGNSGLVWRYLFSKPLAAFKVTRSLAAKAFQNSLPLCKETFFSPQMEDSTVQRYQELMKESSRMPLFDLRKLNASLPVPPVPRSSIEVLVLGAENDFIVDRQGLDETGGFYGVPAVCIEGVAHDLMLDCQWDRGATAILSWLKHLQRNHLQC